MRGITPAQMRKIHVLSKERGLDDEMKHSHVFKLTKKDSLTKLTIMEAIKVIDSLEGKETTSVGMMSPAQKKYIAGLLKQLGWVDESGAPDKKRFMAFVKSQYGVEQEKWITSRIASKAIEALKNMACRKVDLREEVCQ